MSTLYPESLESGGASSGCRERKGRMMNEIDVIKIEKSNLSGVEKIAELQVQNTLKVNELVREWNSHKEWHKRFKQ